MRQVYTQMNFFSFMWGFYDDGFWVLGFDVKCYFDVTGISIKNSALLRLRYATANTMTNIYRENT